MRVLSILGIVFVAVLHSGDCVAQVSVAARQEVQPGEDLLPASRFTLRGRMTIDQALAQIQEQTGNRIGGGRDLTDEIDFDLADAEFWVGLDEILARHKLRLRPSSAREYDWQVEAAMSGQHSGPTHVFHSGGLRLQATACDAIRDFQFPDVDHVRVTFAIYWESRIKPIALQIPMRDWNAETDDGGRLAAKHVESVIEADLLRGQPHTQLSVPFQIHPASAARIRRLTGVVYVVIGAAPQPFEFSELNKQKVPRELSDGDATVRLEDWEANDDGFEVQLRVKYAADHGALESFRPWISENRIELDDGMGTIYKPAGVQVTSAGNDVVLHYQFTQDPESLNLTYWTAKKIHRIPISVEIHDLILP